MEMEVSWGRQCFRAITKGFSEKVTLDLRTEWGGASLAQKRGSVLQVEDAARAEGPRWGQACCV